MGEKRDTDMMHPDELKNDEYGHCGECHEVHQTGKMIEIDGYLYCKKCANPPARSIGEMHQQSAARIAALEAEKAKLMRALADLEAASVTPMTKSRYDFLESKRTQARAVLAEVTK